MMIPARRNGNGLDIFDEVFADPFFGEKENKIMKTDLKEKDGKYMLEIDVPGYDKEDIKIELNEGYLTVSAEKNEEKEDKHAKYLKRERFTGMCSRSYYVGDNLKEEDIKASFKNGILSIEFPKEVEKKVEEKECREQVIYLWKRYLKITNIHKTTVYYLRGMFAPIHLQVLEEFKKFQEIVPFLKLAIEYQEKSV